MVIFLSNMTQPKCSRVFFCFKFPVFITSICPKLGWQILQPFAGQLAIKGTYKTGKILFELISWIIKLLFWNFIIMSVLNVLFSVPKMTNYLIDIFLNKLVK